MVIPNLHCKLEPYMMAMFSLTKATWVYSPTCTDVLAVHPLVGEIDVLLTYTVKESFCR